MSLKTYAFYLKFAGTFMIAFWMLFMILMTYPTPPGSCPVDMVCER